MDLAFHDSRFTAEISKRMQVTIYEILKYRLMNNLMKISPDRLRLAFTLHLKLILFAPVENT